MSARAVDSCTASAGLGEALVRLEGGLGMPVVLQQAGRVAEGAPAGAVLRIPEVEPVQGLYVPPLSVVQRELEGSLEHPLLALESLVQRPASSGAIRAPSDLGQPEAGTAVAVLAHRVAHLQD